MASSIKELIRNGEDSKVEFKKKLTQLEKVAKTLVSFANSSGGIIIIGIQDDKQVVGVIDPDEELFILQKAALNYSDPEVVYSVSETELNGKLVLLVEVDESACKPHRSKCSSGDWQIYVRMGDQCLVASGSVVNVLENQTGSQKAIEIDFLDTNQERLLFDFLELNQTITYGDYAKIIDESEGRAFQILEDLALNEKINKNWSAEGVFFTNINK
jgi:predicted HTH transcriptional regulator